MSPVHGKGRLARTLGGRDPRARRLANRWDRPELILGDGMEIDGSSLLGISLAANPGLEFSAGALKVKVKAVSGVLIGADGLYVDSSVIPLLSTFNNHNARHENGGADEMSVAGLSGLLADGQTPLAHASSHQNGGADEISVAGLSGLLADDQNPTAHASAHEPGGGDAMAVDAAAATGSLRTLGTGAQQATAGNDARLSDARTPTGSAGGDLTGTYPNPTVAADAITYAKMQNVSSDSRLLGRVSLGSGNVEEIPVLSPLSFVGGSLVLTNQDDYTVLTATLDQDVTNAQNTDSTYFTFSVTAAKRYLVDLEMAISGNNTTGDFEFQFAVAAGTMSGGGTTQSLAAGLGVQNVGIIVSGAANTGNLTVGTSNDLEVPIAVRALFAFVPSNTTTFKMQFGNNSAAAGRTSRVMQGSIMRYKQMN